MAARGKQDDGLFKPSTPDGTDMNEATSALIKHLRRGNELEALYWAEQLEKNFHKYVWRRLLIFASEDVSIANPNLVVQVRALADNYEQVKKESRNPVVDRSILTMAIMLICRSEKTRECDDLLNVIGHMTKMGWRPAPLDAAYDLHSQEGKRRWPRSYRLRHWFESAGRELPRTGPRDWHLWLMKWGAQRGVYSVEWVKKVADDWDRRGWLLWGVEGLPQTQWPWENVEPEFEGLEPAAPDMSPVDGWYRDVWDWHCTACKMPLPECQQEADGCCEHCTHGVRDVVDLTRKD